MPTASYTLPPPPKKLRMLAVGGTQPESEADMTELQRPLAYMRFHPAWTFIEGIREFARFFCHRAFADEELAERSRMVIQEMLENGTKYSVSDPDAELELALWSDGKDLEIALTSTPEPKHLEALKAEIANLYSRGAEEAYLAAFMRAQATAEGSRLGLARIRYEGKVDLSLIELDDGRITLVVKGNL